jgi:hypothetical protein
MSNLKTERCSLCGKDFRKIKASQKTCASCVLTVIQEDEESPKIKELRLMGKIRAIRSGNSGITPNGEIVDRRHHPDSMTYQILSERPSIIFNDRFIAGWGEHSCVVIDGKQRLTAIIMFLNDELSVDGKLFYMKGMVKYSDLDVPNQRKFRQTPIPFCEATLPDIESEIEVFELINFGGVPQGETDL